MPTNIKIGSIFHNNNGEDYIIIAINEKKDRTLLLRVGERGNPFYVGAWGITEHSWSQGHYFMNDFEAASDYVNGKE